MWQYLIPGLEYKGCWFFPSSPPLPQDPAAFSLLGSTILDPVLWDSGLPVLSSISNGSEERTQWSCKMSLNQKLRSFAKNLGGRTPEQVQGERQGAVLVLSSPMGMDSRSSIFSASFIGNTQHTHIGQSYYWCRGQGEADNGIRALISPHPKETQNRCPWGLIDSVPTSKRLCQDSAFCSRPHPWSIQMNELMATLLAPLSRFPHSASLPSDCVSLSPAFCPGLSLHLLGLTKAGRASTRWLVVWGGGYRSTGWGWRTIKRQWLSDNNLTSVPAASTVLKNPRSTLGIRAREPIGSVYWAVMCFLKGVFIFPF